MVNCPRCGRSTSLGSTYCAYCGTVVNPNYQTAKSRAMVCLKCGRFMPLRGMVGGKGMCPDCEQRHGQQLAQEKYIEERRRQAHVNDIIARHPEMKAKIIHRIGLVDLDHHFIVEISAYDEILSWDQQLTHAKNLELAKRYEDAAKVYEELGLWKEAGTVRDKKSARTVKHVTVNINDLIEKVRDGGLTIPYKCRSCGATITIDSTSNPDGLKFCSYCGSAVDLDSMLDIIKSALR